MTTPVIETPRRRRWGKWVLPTYSWLVIAYLVFPIAVMILYSFNKVFHGRPIVTFHWNGWTWQFWRQWNHVHGLGAAFWLSIRIALLSTCVATILGTLLALALVRYSSKNFHGKSTVNQILFLNIAAPEIVMGVSLLGLFVTLGINRGFWTLILAHVMFCIAYVTVTVRARLAGFDRTLEEAAYDLGANSWTTFRLITLPLIVPGVLAGAMMSFALSIDDYVTSSFVAGTELPFPVFIVNDAAHEGIPPQVLVFGTFIFAVGIALAISSIFLAKRDPRA
jgi:spermidine/putrescine transport system permease protein